MNDCMKLAENIRKARKNRKLSQTDFGKLLHVSQQTVGSWETGRAIPGSDTLSRIADIFSISTDSLLGKDTRKENQQAETDLFKLIDNARSFDGKPLDDHDRQLVKNIVEGIIKTDK